MILANRSDNRSLAPAVLAAADIPRQAILWVGGDLFPRLAAYWPTSAGHFNANAQHSVEIWCRAILGFQSGQVVMAVDALALDPARQFAPRPAEVRAELLEMFPPAPPAPPSYRPHISMAAVDMSARAAVFSLHKERLGCSNLAAAASTDEEIKAETARLLAHYRKKGIEVTSCFKSILRD